MTKRVRVENADTSNYKVVVQVWDKAYPPPDEQTAPGSTAKAQDTLVREITLVNPCDLAAGDDLYITSTRYLVVKEA